MLVHTTALVPSKHTAYTHGHAVWPASLQIAKKTMSKLKPYLHLNNVSCFVGAAHVWVRCAFYKVVQPWLPGSRLTRENKVFGAHLHKTTTLMGHVLVSVVLHEPSVLLICADRAPTAPFSYPENPPQRGEDVEYPHSRCMTASSIYGCLLPLCLEFVYHVWKVREQCLGLVVDGVGLCHAAAYSGYSFKKC